jgi:hypothetical protein
MSIGKGSFDGAEGTKMNDGTEAWLTPSGSYYMRREPTYEEWNEIAYYNLDKIRVPLAKGLCETCGAVLESKMCGDYQSCECGSFVDTDRWFPERHRYGGDIKQIN